MAQNPLTSFSLFSSLVLQRMQNVVTGRARRCGWFDATLVRQTIKVAGITGIAFTKLDVLDGFEEIFVQDRFSGPGRHYGSRIAWLPDGTLLLSIGDRGSDPRGEGGHERGPHHDEGDRGRHESPHPGADPPVDDLVGHQQLEPLLHERLQGTPKDRRSTAGQRNK